LKESYADSSGTHGFIKDGDVFTTIDVPGALETLPFGLNNRGQIVGIYSTSSGGHSFIYEKGVFSTIAVPNSMATGARGINDNGQIVGGYIDSNSIDHGFVATPTTK